MSQIKAALTKLFESHRIVFWYDAKSELRGEFTALELPGVEKIVLGNNQFGVKHRILREQPEQKFLLYHAGPPPADVDNWLLDVELAYGVFRADQTSLWLSELGLGPEFGEVVQPHTGFLQAARRREALKVLLQPADTPRQVRMNMLAVCAGAEARLDDILENLLAELAANKDEKIRLIQRSGLDGFLWEQLERAYGYRSDTPGLRDFTIELFKSCYALTLGEKAKLGSDALVFLKRWKDSVRHHEAFEALSGQCAGILAIEQDLAPRDYRDLLAVDIFEAVDRKVLSDLVQVVANRTLAGSDCARVIGQRRQSPWYGQYRHVYEAIGYAAEFFYALAAADLTVASFGDGVRQYVRSWYRLDQGYRQFVHHARQSGQPTLLAALAEQVENFYTNNYLLKVNDRWQTVVDACDRWETDAAMRQDAFFELAVRKEFLQKGNKVFVVISDALRYEVGEELLRLIRQEDRYEASLEPGLTLLPSYTRLGMAALLPHEVLSFSDNGEAVLVDGNSSIGLENRHKALDRALPGRARAIKADNLLAMGKDEARSLVRDHDVVYVYHDRIDLTGDKRDAEEQVFEAVQATLEDLVRTVKKLVNANASNVLVTADHGFIYQNQPLEESDFLSTEPEGAEVLVRNRRFVLGRGFTSSPSFKKFTAAQVGVEGDATSLMEMLIPKSINRLRIKGAGSRYVHGGASLQEIIIPVLRVSKKRESDVSTVDVDILRGATTVITSGQLAVTLYQTGPITDKVQPRTLAAGIYTQAGVLISDSHELTFDLTAENARERERRVQFVLTRKSDAANGQEVVLRLDERVPETSHYREYKTVRYLLRRSFTSDFEL